MIVLGALGFFSFCPRHLKVKLETTCLCSCYFVLHLKIKLDTGLLVNGSFKLIMRSIKTEQILLPKVVDVKGTRLEKLERFLVSLRESLRFLQPFSFDHIRRFLSYHIHHCHCVTSRDDRYNRSIHNTQVVHSIDLQFRIYYCTAIPPWSHLTSATLMMKLRGDVAHTTTPVCITAKCKVRAAGNWSCM